MRANNSQITNHNLFGFEQSNGLDKTAKNFCTITPLRRIVADQVIQWMASIVWISLPAIKYHSTAHDGRNRCECTEYPSWRAKNNAKQKQSESNIRQREADWIKEEKKSWLPLAETDSIDSDGERTRGTEKMFLIETKSLKVSQALRAYRQKLNYTYWRRCSVFVAIGCYIYVLWICSLSCTECVEHTNSDG